MTTPKKGIPAIQKKTLDFRKPISLNIAEFRFGRDYLMRGLDGAPMSQEAKKAWVSEVQAFIRGAGMKEKVDEAFKSAWWNPQTLTIYVHKTKKKGNIEGALNRFVRDKILKDSNFPVAIATESKKVRDIYEKKGKMYTYTPVNIKKGDALTFDYGHLKREGASAGAFGRLYYGQEEFGQIKDTKKFASKVSSASSSKGRLMASHKEMEAFLNETFTDSIEVEVEKVVGSIINNMGAGVDFRGLSGTRSKATLEFAPTNRKLGYKFEGGIVEGIEKVFNEIREKIEKAAQEEIPDILAEYGFSPTEEEQILAAITDVIVGKKVNKGKKKKTTVKPKKGTKFVKVAKKKVPVPTPKPKIDKQRGQVEAQMSPVALQTLLNKAINEAIKVNMGKGAATKVLNYRTGRFAESVEIDAVAPRRDGAMVAFYNYMKNPYATFAPGGAQYAREPSRDPNKLIRKSMRQIAAAAAVTRFFPQEA